GPGSSRVRSTTVMPSSGRAEPAMADTVEEVEDETDGEPDDESLPSHARELEHQVDTADGRAERHTRHERRTKGTRAVGVRAPQDEHAEGDQDEGEQRSDVGELDHLVDVGDAGEHGNQDAGDDRRDVGGPVSRMHACGPGREEPVASHREENPRLTELEDNE